MARRKRLFAVAGALGAAALGTILQARPAFADTYSPSAASQLVAAINSLRASHGLDSLSVNSSLVSMADSWSVRLSGAGTLSHNPSLASAAPAGWRLLGENVGVGPSATALQEAFTNSPEHYANMVNSNFTDIGVGVYVTSAGYMWVTEDYLQSPSAAASPSPAPAPVAATPAPVIIPTVSVPAVPTPVTHALVASSQAPAIQSPPQLRHHSGAVPAPARATQPPASAAAPVTVAMAPPPPLAPGLARGPRAALPTPSIHSNRTTPRVGVPRPTPGRGNIYWVDPAAMHYASDALHLAMLGGAVGGLAYILKRRLPGTFSRRQVLALER